MEDPLIEIATREVLAERKTRTQISHEIRRKEKAVAHLKQTYQNRNLSSDDVHLCLYSIWYVNVKQSIIYAHYMSIHRTWEFIIHLLFHFYLYSQ